MIDIGGVVMVDPRGVMEAMWGLAAGFLVPAAGVAVALAFFRELSR